MALLVLLGSGGMLARHALGNAMPAASHAASHACCPADAPVSQHLPCPHLPAQLGLLTGDAGPAPGLRSSTLLAPGATSQLAGRVMAPATPPPRAGSTG